MSDFRKIVENVLQNEVCLTENPNTILKSALVGKNPDVESFAILTSENPLGQQYSRRDNKARLTALKNQLKSGGHPYKNIVGQYGNKENSFVIFNVSRKLAENYARTYEQDSFVFGIKTKDGMVYEFWKTLDGAKSYKLIDKQNTLKNDSDADEFFSRLHDYKFQIPFDLDEAMEEELSETLSRVQSPEDKQWIKEYVNGNRVGMSSYYHYKWLYGTKRLADEKVHKED